MRSRRVDESAGELLVEGLEFDYARPGEKPDCQWRLKAERERMLTGSRWMPQRALLAVEQADGLLERRGRSKRRSLLLEELIGQDFDVDEDDVPRLHRGTRPGRIISAIDPEMRHGRKSQHQRFDGYKLSAAVTNSSEPLIMSVHVCPGGESDGPQAKHLIDAQPAERRPERILGDTAYGNGPVRGDLAERQVDVLAPVPEGTVLEEGRLRKADFAIDLDAGTVTCPAGHTVAISDRDTRGSSCEFRQDALRRLSAEGCVLPDTAATADPAGRARGASDRRPRRAR